jgi:hypothetical protein
VAACTTSTGHVIIRVLIGTEQSLARICDMLSVRSTFKDQEIRSASKYIDGHGSSLGHVELRMYNNNIFTKTEIEGMEVFL